VEERDEERRKKKSKKKSGRTKEEDRAGLDAICYQRNRVVDRKYVHL
jgi:hypothetical protein